MAILYSLNYYTFLMICNMKLPEKIRSTDLTLGVLKYTFGVVFLHKLKKKLKLYCSGVILT